MILDFSFLLVMATLLTGIIWGLDSLFFKAARERRAAAAQTAAREPIVVEYARAFFPIILIVLLVRSFLFEPFRIPSDSMKPTLLDGDFIFVNKYTYGLRLPVLNLKILPIGDPHRGDVIVFRLPSDPSISYIKRLVGLPGDKITVRGSQLYINDKPVPVTAEGPYEGRTDVQLAREDLFGVEHDVLFMPEKMTKDYEQIVPEGKYFFMGDNRDNSQDSRFERVGFVPEGNLVGKAVRIWLNWRGWNRIGKAIH
jgi:signal peptidase I